MPTASPFRAYALMLCAYHVAGTCFYIRRPSTAQPGRVPVGAPDAPHSPAPASDGRVCRIDLRAAAQSCARFRSIRRGGQHRRQPLLFAPYCSHRSPRPGPAVLEARSPAPAGVADARGVVVVGRAQTPDRRTGHPCRDAPPPAPSILGAQPVSRGLPCGWPSPGIRRLRDAGGPLDRRRGADERPTRDVRRRNVRGALALARRRAGREAAVLRSGPHAGPLLPRAVSLHAGAGGGRRTAGRAGPHARGRRPRGSWPGLSSPFSPRSAASIARQGAHNRQVQVGVPPR
eukprot:scaffold11313_cov146-Isochrysis_galbana.AAC.3